MKTKSQTKILLWAVAYINQADASAPWDNVRKEPKPAGLRKLYLRYRDDGVFSNDYELIGKQTAQDISGSLDKWLKGTEPSGGSVSCVKAFIEYALFKSNKSQLKSLSIPFSALPLDNKDKAEIEKAFNSTLRVRGCAFGLDFDLSSPTVINSLVANNQPLGSQQIYHSPFAPELWDHVKVKRNKYPHYYICHDNLAKLLDRQAWKSRIGDLQMVLNLGAGGADKDELIIQSLVDAQSTATFIWVDASYPMLVHTLKTLQTDLVTFNKLNKFSVIADFTHLENVQTVLSRDLPSVPILKQARKKAIFILGFTLSNINEKSFFDSYLSHMNKGDLMVFPLEFLPSSVSEQKSYKEKLTNNYHFDLGEKLALEGLAFLDKKTYDYEHPKCEVIPYSQTMINGVPDVVLDKGIDLAVSVEYKIKVTTIDRDLITEVVTVRSTRHIRECYEQFFKEKGLKIIDDETENNITTFLLEYQPEPKHE